MSTLPSNLAQKIEKLTPVTVQPTDVLRIFKSTKRHMQYCFSNGMIAEFINHRYYTKRPDQIAALEAEIRNGHAHIYIDEKEMEIVAEDRDPTVALKKRLRAELIAEGYVKIDPANDMGNSVQGPLNVATTTDVASTAGGGNGVGSAAQLNDLAKVLADRATSESASAPVKMPPIPGKKQ